MEFLSHIVNAQGIKPSPEKVKAMLDMPTRKTLKEVESFVEMVQYYGNFIPRLSFLCAPINALRKKDVQFQWDREQQEVFEAIKSRLTATDVLAHYDPKEAVVLVTDASEYGLGAVIYHQYKDGTERVIAHASRSLTKEERNYAQIEKEALGIVYGVKKIGQFLYGRKFTLLTDHQPLVKIFGPKHGLPIIAAKRLHRWALRLMVYSFDIQYRQTDEFGNADGLSRLPNAKELPSSELVIDAVTAEITEGVMAELPFSEEQIAEKTTNDLVLNKVLQYV